MKTILKLSISFFVLGICFINNINSDDKKNNVKEAQKTNSKEKEKSVQLGNEISQIDKFTAKGEVSRDLIIPQIDNGVLKSLILADTMRGMPGDKMVFESMVLRLYNNGKLDMIIRMPLAVFDVATNIIACEYKTVIQSQNGFLIIGDGMTYNLKDSFGRMRGNVKMVFDSKEKPKDKKSKKDKNITKVTNKK